MKPPVVSIIIDTFNHGAFLRDALESVLAQDAPLDDVEILVIDDGSTDQTPALVEPYTPRVRYLRKENGGQASAFNAGIAASQGELLFFLDGDDWWAPHKLRTVRDVFDQYPDIGAVGHAIVEIDGVGNHRELRPCRIERLHVHDAAAAGRFRELKCFFGTSRFAARRRVLEAILPVPESLVVEADEYLFTAAPAVADVLLLEEPLTFYRLHAGNLYQFRGADPLKLRRKQQVLAALVEVLPPCLARLGVPRQASDVLLEPIDVEATRLRLLLEGGRPWETFRVEQRAFRMNNPEAGWLERAWRTLPALLSVVLPPRRYYQLRSWYGATVLAGLRSLLRRGPEPIEVRDSQGD
jgi:hypothetical protein